LRWLSDSFSAFAQHFLSYIADSQRNERQDGWNTVWYFLYFQEKYRVNTREQQWRCAKKGW